MRNILVVLAVLLVTSARADVILPGEHSIEYCAIIGNLGDYPDYVFFHWGAPGADRVPESALSSLVPVQEGECMRFYKFNRERVYAVHESKYYGGNYGPGDLLVSEGYMTAVAVLPDSDPRTKVTDTYFVELDAQRKTLSLAVADTTSQKNTWTVHRIALFALAAALTLLIELAIAFGYCRWRGADWNGVKNAVIVGNIISLPVVWLLVPYFFLTGVLLILASEVLAFGIEYAVLRKYAPGVSNVEAALLSAVMNTVSYAAGMAAFPLFAAVLPL
ncbi:MAG: hypothetical protein V1787_05770 [Candidatus Micrarchaeota archaeon]